MIEIGRLCMKIAGRDAGRYCLIIEIIDKTYVLIDGATRRKKCNISHLELLGKVAKVKAKAEHKRASEELEPEEADRRRSVFVG